MLVHTWLEVPLRLHWTHGVKPEGHVHRAHVLFSGEVPRPEHGTDMYSAGCDLHIWHSRHFSACG